MPSENVVRIILVTLPSENPVVRKVSASGVQGFPENEVRVFGGSRYGGRRRARLTGTPTALQFAAGNPYYAAKKPH